VPFAFCVCNVVMIARCSSPRHSTINTNRLPVPIDLFPSHKLLYQISHSIQSIDSLSIEQSNHFLQTSLPYNHNMSLFEPAPEPPTSLGRYRVLSKTAGIRVSPLQLGAMSLGKAWEGMLGSMDKKAAFELLDAFVAAGGNFIDT
jgi:hypothetical protein